jgi:hypothetical protein
MPVKRSGESADWTEIDRFDGGVGWIAHPGETMQRASHALATDGGVWVVDPVDADGVDDLLAEFGEVRGVVTLLDRHKRDSAAVANRHDVPVYLPEFFEGVADELDAPVERFQHDLAETGFAVHEVVGSRFWQEAALFDRDSGVLVVPEAVGTADYFRAASERLGVHPMLRLTPPSKLGRFDPERVLVGHGVGVHEEAATALGSALSGARARTPGLVVRNTRKLLPL